MSYTNENRRGSPLGMVAAITINGSIILAVALSPVVVDHLPKATVITGHNIKERPVPPPDKPVEKQPSKNADPIFTPDRAIDTKMRDDTGLTTTTQETDTTNVLDGIGGGDDIATGIRDLPPPPTPLFKAALRDPRFARDFQPDYPVGKLRLEIEGSVTVRVLIGTNGRVREVQVIRATDPDFARATERQALKSWRFKPATRDGTPVEDWQTLTVRFDIN